MVAEAVYERLVLRYSGADTVAAHQLLIADRGGTWWGWWQKKDQEPFALEFLRWLQSECDRGGSRIGLVDRKDSLFAVGICSAVAFADDGSDLPAPDGGMLTPEYYREGAFPAWFRFDHIDRLNLADFEREFSGIPVGEKTLFVLNRDGEDRELLPRPNWDFTRRRVDGAAVLHLSDLHFGVHHGYRVGRDRSAVRGPTLAERIVQCIDTYGRAISAVFITGDLVSKGENIAETLSIFATFAGELRRRLGLLPHQFAIIPGNHDFRKVTDPVEMKKDYAHELEFKQFLRDFYELPAVTDVERPFRFELESGVELYGIALNSARLRGEKSKEYGYVAKHRYDQLIRLLADAVSSDDVMSSKVFCAMLHHHVLPVNDVEAFSDDRPVSVTLDAGELMRTFAEAGVKAIFHGHQHLPFIGSFRASTPAQASWDPMAYRPEVLVLGAGSAGAQRASLPDAFPFNSFCIHEFPGEGALRVNGWQYLPGVDPVRTGAIALATGSAGDSGGDGTD